MHFNKDHHVLLIPLIIKLKEIQLLHTKLNHHVAIPTGAKESNSNVSLFIEIASPLPGSLACMPIYTASIRRDSYSS